MARTKQVATGHHSEALIKRLREEKKAREALWLLQKHKRREIYLKKKSLKQMAKLNIYIDPQCVYTEEACSGCWKDCLTIVISGEKTFQLHQVRSETPAAGSALVIEVLKKLDGVELVVALNNSMGHDADWLKKDIVANISNVRFLERELL